MLRKTTLLVWLAVGALACAPPSPTTPPTPPDDNGHHVVLLTLDGVRWQDVFDTPDAMRRKTGQAYPLPFFRKTFTSSGAWLKGNLDVGDDVRTSSGVPLSLPGYQVLFGGQRTACTSNDCPRPSSPTLLDVVAERLGATHVAAFASWKQTRLAVTSSSSPAFTVDIPTPASIRRDKRRPRWRDARFDDVTYQHALDRVRHQPPRLLLLSLLDTDEWAHNNKPRAYVDALQTFDVQLQRLVRLLDDKGVLQRTTFLVTTDHGRDDGEGWTGHGRRPEGRHIWMAAKGPGVTPPSSTPLQQADLRPTVEALLGMTPTPCTDDSCGRVMTSVVQR